MTQTPSEEAYDALEREFGVFLRRARAASGQLSRAVHPELDSTAYGLLVCLRDRGLARSSDLAAFVGVGKPTISRQLRALEDLGLIRRRADPGDGRAHLLELTDEGRRRLDAVRSARRRHFRARLRSWPEEDVSTLATLLARLNALAAD
ncbi:MarR family winged helix-turn-helix transcriptional regulator [Actinomadura fibrosa]|uniref:MarR family winged helix-turn-helix transcriptional regulator n=1 Tax=Actinomadura fibrosa TaxID=111802 RepID=A0ABW2XKI0_9ACTN|nr:MarR family transcriptional regulator [Actinomadura fibrosa]